MKYKVAGTYNYKGNDYVVFYIVKRDGTISLKKINLTAKSTSSHFFPNNVYKLNEEFNKFLNNTHTQDERTRTDS